MDAVEANLTPEVRIEGYVDVDPVRRLFAKHTVCRCDACDAFTRTYFARRPDVTPRTDSGENGHRGPKTLGVSVFS